jgi:hypothetical protein
MSIWGGFNDEYSGEDKGDVVNIPLPHADPHNLDSCPECARQRMKKAKKHGETADMHDAVTLKNHYGGYW